MSRELPDIQAGFRKGRTRDPIANIGWIMEKAREFQKNTYFCFINYAKAFDCVDHKKLWKILKEMGIPEHLTCLLINLYAGQEATVRTGHGTTDWFQLGKGVCQGSISSPCLFNFYAEYIMRNAGLEETQAGIKISRRSSFWLNIKSLVHFPRIPAKYLKYVTSLSYDIRHSCQCLMTLIFFLESDLVIFSDV